MKLTLTLLIALSSLTSCSHWNSKNRTDDAKRNLASVNYSPDALMSPAQGEEAFARLYELISDTKKYAHITAYSWSDGGLEKAIEKALGNKAKVRVILHPDLKTSAKVLNVVPKLEAMGAEFKFAAMNMHEKFTVIDDDLVVNTSANFSNGAKNKYSENIVFHELSKDNSESIKSLIRDFKNEFVILWNTSKDITTNKEENAVKLEEVFKKENIPTANVDMALYSSSMNWTLKDNAATSVVYKNGKYQSLVKKMYPNKNEQTWTVRDAILAAIKNADKSIYLSLNHFNIRVVSDALIEAVKRGVDVRLAVDNQEYKSKPNDLEMSPQFVADWKTLKGAVIPPVRVKYYSHEPSPRSWLLNHHKFILVDYEDSSKTVLLSGSYNLSATAEQNQFDNLVVYRTPKYKDLYKSFYNEFENQWTWNRVNDKPKQENLDLFMATKNNSYPVHVSEAVSLTWPEVMNLRAEVNKKAPGIFSGLSKNRDCLYYDPAKKQYWACPNGN
jgi:phosphatidylserine/phosphatidylglycerophosphate/cardiolipin synthase-like enzyme